VTKNLTIEKWYVWGKITGKRTYIFGDIPASLKLNIETRCTRNNVTKKDEQYDE